MRDLKLEELEMVYGAGGDGRSCSPCPPSGGSKSKKSKSKKSKSKKSKSKSSKSKSRNHGSRGWC